MRWALLYCAGALIALYARSIKAILAAKRRRQPYPEADAKKPFMPDEFGEVVS